jgi:hypothetical protein
MLFKEVIAVYREKHTRPINRKCTVTDWRSRWWIYLRLGFEGLNMWDI